MFDAACSAPITKGAGGDFTHHRGIYIGWMKIGVNGKTLVAAAAFHSPGKNAPAEAVTGAK